MTPQEIPKLNHHEPARVDLVGGGHVTIDPHSSVVRVYTRTQFDRQTMVFRQPLAAVIRDDELYMWDPKHPEPAEFLLIDIERTEITQHDESRSMPIWIGVLVGGTMGALIGAAVAGDCSPNAPEGSICLGPAGAAVFLGIGGAGLGALIAIPFVADRKYYGRDEE